MLLMKHTGGRPLRRANWFCYSTHYW